MHKNQVIDENDNKEKVKSKDKVGNVALVD
jgi:hypothetical protein